MSLDFTAIDFETASGRPGSACSVGLVRVRDGQVVHKSRAGAIPEKDATGRTSILVIGDLNPAVLTPGAATTGKAKRAFALQAKGQDIEVMTEDDFLRSL